MAHVPRTLRHAHPSCPRHLNSKLASGCHNSFRLVALVAGHVFIFSLFLLCVRVSLSTALLANTEKEPNAICQTRKARSGGSYRKRTTDSTFTRLLWRISSFPVFDDPVEWVPVRENNKKIGKNLHSSKQSTRNYGASFWGGQTNDEREPLAFDIAPEAQK